MEKFEIFDDYLNDNLDPEARLLFEEQLLTDNALKQFFNDYKIALELIKYEGLKSEVAKANKHYKTRKGTKNSFPIIKIAAIVIFGLLTFSAFWVGQTEGKDLLEYLPIEYIEPNQRGDNKEKLQAESLYLRKDYERLIELYNLSIEPTEKLIFLTSMAFFNREQYEKALVLIDKLEIKIDGSQYKNELEFYKCQSLIGLNKYSDAMEEILKMDASNPYKSTFDWTYIAKIKILDWKDTFF